MGHTIIKLLLIFYQKREKLHDEEERKSAWVSQERQRTLDRLRTFKQVIKVWSIYCFSLLFKQNYIYTPIVRFLRKAWFSVCYLENDYNHGNPFKFFKLMF